MRLAAVQNPEALWKSLDAGPEAVNSLPMLRNVASMWR